MDIALAILMVVKPPIHQVIIMVAVEHRLVAASRAVLVLEQMGDGALRLCLPGLVSSELLVKSQCVRFNRLDMWQRAIFGVVVIVPASCGRRQVIVRRVVRVTMLQNASVEQEVSVAVVANGDVTASRTVGVQVRI
jgi:hypothetical protein